MKRRTVLFDKVCLYKEIGDCEFKDLWIGYVNDIPHQYLDCKIGSVGAKRKGIIEIRILEEK